jgi:hypothetical protein
MLYSRILMQTLMAIVIAIVALYVYGVCPRTLPTVASSSTLASALRSHLESLRLPEVVWGR